MIFIRSLIFNIAFYVSTLLQMVLQMPFYFILPRKMAYVVPKNWARSNLWLMRVIVGTKIEIEGLEHLTKSAFILSPKHQSSWDTFALIPWIDDPVYILKRELLWIPLFGWYAAKQRMIPINRAAGGRAMVEMLKRAHEEMEAKRQLIIYPEGTRRPTGAPPEYKFGIARLYAALNVPVIPVVMHPGLFWPRHKFLRYPGTIKVKILPPIEPGMDQSAFFSHLVSTMEAASDQLLIETVKANPHIPLPETVRNRLAELKTHGPDA